MKLSDTQLLILASASQRTDHTAVLPANLKGSAAKTVVDKLLNEKLLQEFRAKDDMPVWRRGDDNALFIADYQGRPESDRGRGGRRGAGQ
jgi:hypothetical protein